MPGTANPRLLKYTPGYLNKQYSKLQQISLSFTLANRAFALDQVYGFNIFS
jgi:hypothetical protein